METRNLFIRDTQFKDCEYFSLWEKNKDVTEFFSIGEDRDYEEVTREYIERSLDKTKIQLTIFLKETNEPIGRIYISLIDYASDSCDITRIYIADPKHRGKGYGEEALRVILYYCFINLHMERVTLDHFTGNNRAAALYLKIGFQYEGVARNAAKKNGRYYDLHLMSMLRTEYFEKAHNDN